MNNLTNLFVGFNPWWSGRFAVDFKARDIYTQIEGYFDSKQIIALTGLRRTGKTTILKKVISDYLNSGFESTRIFFFSFDDASDVELLDLIKEYEKTVGFSITSGKFLLIFDEVQKLRNWAEQVKILYDLYSPSVKILVSGSESLFIKKKSKESLAGRIYEFKVEPLNFREFLNFKNVNYDLSPVFEGVLKVEFVNYFKTQGFPELVNENNEEKVARYLKEGIIEKIVYVDLPKTFKIRNTETLKQLINIIIENPGQAFEIERLASDLKTTRQAVSTYLNYLQDAFVVKKLYNYSKNLNKQERKLKKYYSLITSPRLVFSSSNLDRSVAFENFMVVKLGAEYFWRDERKNEVDVILVKNGVVSPVEVKYGEVNSDGVLAFLSKFKLSFGSIVTLDKEYSLEFNAGKIKVIPAWKYLLE